MGGLVCVGLGGWWHTPEPVLRPPTREEQKHRDALLRKLFPPPPQPRPKRKRKGSPHYLVIDGKMRVAGNFVRNDDGSITADVYRNLVDYDAGRPMGRAGTFRD